MMAERLAAVTSAPGLVLSSPADRALETARVFTERFGVGADAIVQREDLYGGLLPEEFLRIVHLLDDRQSSVFVFGHDPSFSEFAALLVRGFGDVIPKGGCLVIDLPRTSWRAVRPGDGRVVWFERPPAPDVQKRLEAELGDRLAGSIRSAMFAALRGFDVPDNPDVVRAVARAAARIAKTALPSALVAAARAKPARQRKTAAKARRRKAVRS